MPVIKSLRKSVFKLVLFLLIFGLSFLLFFWGKNYFSVKKIEIYGLANDAVLRGVDKLKSQNIFLLSALDKEKEIFNLNSFLTKVEIKKKLPDTLILFLTQQSSVAALKTSEGFFYLNNEGRIIEKAKKNKGYPVINFYQKLNYLDYSAGEKLDFKDLIAALKYLEKAKELRLNINSVDIVGFYMIALNLQDKIIIFSIEKTVAKQLVEFEEVIKQFRIKGINFKKIDFRFDKPIVQLQ